MAETSKFPQKLTTLTKALESLNQALTLQYDHFGELERDLIEGGQIQKFEYSLELFWKTAKTLLYDVHGIEAMSPKMVMKELYRTKYLSEDEYQASLAMINDRNRLSHIYDEESFREIHHQLPNHLQLLQIVTARFS